MNYINGKLYNFELLQYLFPSHIRYPDRLAYLFIFLFNPLYARKAEVKIANKKKYNINKLQIS